MTKPDTMKTIGDTNLVSKSSELLDAVIENSGVLKKKEMDNDGLKKAKVVCAFLNGHINSMKTKMSYFKMMGVGDKVKAVKKRSKNFK